MESDKKSLMVWWMFSVKEGNTGLCRRAQNYLHAFLIWSAYVFSAYIFSAFAFMYTHACNYWSWINVDHLMKCL